MQVHLFQELLARFHGPNSRRWYLSDGGHFENTACYELLRRRVPYIVCVDAGQDTSRNGAVTQGLQFKSSKVAFAMNNIIHADREGANHDNGGN